MPDRLALASVFACLLLCLPTTSLPSTPSLKQATRNGIVEQMRQRMKREERALAPRTSPFVCITPDSTYPSQYGTDASGFYSVFINYYYGSQLTEDPDNPGAAYGTPITTPFAYSDATTAIEACAVAANDARGGYQSFDLSFLKSTCAWSCTMYYGPNQDSSAFDITNTDVLLGYGYSV